MAELKYLDLEGLTTFWEKAKQYIDDADEATAGSITYSNSSETTIDVGGIEAGTTFENQTIKQMFDMLLYPYVAPFGISVRGNTNGGTFEYGTTQTVTTVTVSATKGSVDFTTSNLYRGTSATGSAIDTYSFSSGETSHTYTLADAESITDGNLARFTATMTDGTTTLSGTTGAFGRIYPFFHGVVGTDKSAATLTSDEIIAATKDVTSKGTKTYSYTTDNNKAMIAYPTSYGTLKKITDSSGVTDYTNAFGTPSTVAVTSTNPAWGPVDYYVYTNGNSTASGFQYRFTF